MILRLGFLFLSVYFIEGSSTLCTSLKNMHVYDAVKSGKRELVELRLMCNSSEDLKADENGQTPLMIAAHLGDNEIFEMLKNKTLMQKTNNFTAVDRFGQSVLHLAVIGGNLDILETVLQQNKISVSSCDNDGNSVLHLIALEMPRNNTLKICERILEEGATADIKNNHYLTPFHITLEKSSNLTVPILEKILGSRKIGFRIPDYKGRTPFQISLDKRNKKAFDLFIHYEANPFYTDHNGRTVVHNAVLKDYGLEFLQAILSYKGNFRGDFERIVYPNMGLNIRDRDGYTALHLAAERGLEEIFYALFHHKDVNNMTVNDYEETTLISAVKGGAYAIVETLVNTTASVKCDEGSSFIDKGDEGGMTALHISVEANRIDFIEKLLKSNADPNKKDKNDLSSRALAASYCPLKTVKLLFCEECKYEVVEMLGRAVANGNDEEVIQFFLENASLKNLTKPYQLDAARGLDEHLANITSTNTSVASNFSETINIITKDHMYILTELAEVDEDEVRTPFSSEHSLLNLALFFQGNLTTFEILMNYSSTSQVFDCGSKATWMPIDIAAFRNKIDVLNFLVRKDNCLIHRRDRSNQTVMHKAAWGGHCEAIRFIHNISRELINRKDKFLRTPLHIAAMRGYSDAVQCILNLDKRSLEAPDDFAFTPLHLAEIYGHHKFFSELQVVSVTLPPSVRHGMKFRGVDCGRRNHTATIEVLLKAGADPNRHDKTFRWTALHWAAANGDLAVVKLLNKARVNFPSFSGQTPLYLARFWGRRKVYNYLKELNAVW